MDENVLMIFFYLVLGIFFYKLFVFIVVFIGFFFVIL